MLSALTIRGFRCFDHFQMNGLERINLIVGGNDSGKTVVLEAVEFLTSGADPARLMQALTRRREEQRRPRISRLAVRHLFRGHVLASGSRIEIAGVPHGHAEVQVLPAVTVEQIVVDGQPALRHVEMPNRLMLSFLANGTPRSEPMVLTPDNAVLERALPPRPDPDGQFRSTFVPTDLPDAHRLAGRWDAIVGTPIEGFVVEVLRAIQPAVTRVVFTTDGQIFLNLEGRDERFPIGSFGEGMRRLLSLAVHLATAAGGTLLIDEIDTGLHHRTLEKVWRLLARAAKELDVQVFATTHSGDCLRAVGWLHRTEPEVVQDVAVFRIDRDRPTAIRFSPADVDTAIEAMMELRG